MKRSKFIIFALLAVYLVLISCTETRDPIVYKSESNLFLPENFTSGRLSLFNIKLSLDVYGDDVLDHEAFMKIIK